MNIEKLKSIELIVRFLIPLATLCSSALATASSISVFSEKTKLVLGFSAGILNFILAIPTTGFLEYTRNIIRVQRSQSVGHEDIDINQGHQEQGNVEINEVNVANEVNEVNVVNDINEVNQVNVDIYSEIPQKKKYIPNFILNQFSDIFGDQKLNRILSRIDDTQGKVNNDFSKPLWIPFQTRWE